MNKLKDILVIANPPYGSVGANIVDNIRKNINYQQFICLLPANDYKRNSTKDLFNYQSNMISFRDGFEDAMVTTHLAKIHKEKVNNLTAEEFDRSVYLDRSLDKYFEVLSTKQHYAIDKSIYKPKLKDFDKTNLKTCLYLEKRCIRNRKFALSEKSASYRVNKLRNITTQDLIKISAKSEQALGNVGDFSLVIFNTEQEQKNITDFLYSELGYKFMTKVLTSINADSYCSANKFIPKVDWTKPWSLEEILKDYNYSNEEIKDIIGELK